MIITIIITNTITGDQQYQTVTEIVIVIIEIVCP